MSVAEPIPHRLRAAYAAARETCRTHSHSFYFASHFLPSPKREHAYAVYAFCRRLDDAADEAGSRETLDHFAAHLDECYGQSVDPERDGSLAPFAHTVRACNIPRRHFDTLAAGCRMDLLVNRYDTWTELERYCYRVAGVVGQILCHVFDVCSPDAQAHAIAMGNAMQLTNILRDVREDLDRGRVYLPLEELEKFKVGSRQLALRRWTPPFANLMRFQVKRARALYREGAAGIGHIANDGSRLTACMMAVLYSGILQSIESLEYDVFRHRAAVSTIGKFRRLPKAIKLARCEIGDDVPDVF